MNGNDDILYDIFYKKMIVEHASKCVTPSSS
jgi:hypothetical protein